MRIGQRSRTAGALLAASAVVMLLSSCVSGGPGNSGSTDPQPLTAAQIRDLAGQEMQAGHNEQSKLLHDGKVTLDEYATAFGLLSQCLTSQGVRVTSPVMNPVSNDRYAFSYDFAGIAQDVALKAIDGCESKYWKSVSIAYSSGVSPHMDAAVIAETSQCLQTQKVKVSGSPTSMRDFVDEVGQKKADVVETCVQKGVHKLYPQLTSFSIGGY